MKNCNSLKPCFHNSCEIDTKEWFDFITLMYLELKKREEKIIEYLEEHAEFY